MSGSHTQTQPNTPYSTCMSDGAAVVHTLPSNRKQTKPNTPCTTHTSERAASSGNKPQCILHKHEDIYSRKDPEHGQEADFIPLCHRTCFAGRKSDRYSPKYAHYEVGLSDSDSEKNIFWSKKRGSAPPLYRGVGDVWVKYGLIIYN